jgi:hypothetical protein
VRKEVYLALHPETAEGQAQAAGMNRKLGNNVSDKSSLTFTADTAAKTGRSRKSIERDAKRAAAILPEALEAITGTELDTAPTWTPSPVRAGSRQLLPVFPST